MTDANGDQIFEYTQVVPLGNTIQFKFINGNNWGPGQDEGVPQTCGVPNGVGGYNRELTPTASEAVLVRCVSLHAKIARRLQRRVLRFQ